MSVHTTHVVPAPRTLVWNWHTTRGAVARLNPGFFPLVPQRVADRLSDGTTVFSLPAGLRWESRHDLSAYVTGHSFSDVCVASPIKVFAQWRHHHLFQDHEEGTIITDRVNTRLPRSTVEPMFAYRQHQLIEDFGLIARLQHHFPGAVVLPDEVQSTYDPRTVAQALTIAMTGSRSVLGQALAAQLRTLGHRVIELVEPKTKESLGPDMRAWEPLHPAGDLLEGVDHLIHLAGHPLVGRFNDSHKHNLIQSRVAPTRALAKLVAASDCQSFVVSSLIGAYGYDRGDEPLTEDSSFGSGFLAELVADWEEACSVAGTRVVNIRSGIVLSGAGGILPILKAVFKIGLGGEFDGGSSWFSWIALDDLCDIYVHAIMDSSMIGPVNACAPNPVTNAELTKALAQALKRPAVFPIPAFGPKVLLGSQGAKELVLANQRVVPAYLLQREHHFRYPSIDQALAHELGTESLFA